jgi:hypothetical protein
MLAPEVINPILGLHFIPEMCPKEWDMDRSMPVAEIKNGPMPEIKNGPMPEIKNGPMPEIKKGPMPEIKKK